MKLWKEGDRSAGVCEVCKKRVATVFERRNIVPEPGLVVPNVLVAACSDCGEVVSIPYQSTPRINQARKEHPAKGQDAEEPELDKAEVRIPMELEDALGLLARKYGMSSRDAITSPAVRYYLFKARRDPKVELRLIRIAQAAGKGSMRGRITVRIPSSFPDRPKAAQRAVRRGLAHSHPTRSQLVRGALLAAAIDSGVIPPLYGIRPSRVNASALDAIAFSSSEAHIP